VHDRNSPRPCQWAEATLLVDPVYILIEIAIGDYCRVGGGKAYQKSYKSSLTNYMEIYIYTKKLYQLLVERLAEEIKLPNIPGWSGPEKALGDMYRWGKKIGQIHLIIRCSKIDETKNYEIDGIFWDVSTLDGKRWLISDNKKFELDFQLTPQGDIAHKDGDIVVTGRGAGELIIEDVSTPMNMAAYLEKLAQ